MSFNPVVEFRVESNLSEGLKDLYEDASSNNLNSSMSAFAGRLFSKVGRINENSCGNEAVSNLANAFFLGAIRNAFSKNRYLIGFAPASKVKN